MVRADRARHGPLQHGFGRRRGIGVEGRITLRKWSLPNRDAELPEPGKYYNPREDQNWAVMIHAVLAELSINALVSGPDRSEKEPREGTVFVPADGDGRLWIGDGDTWIELGNMLTDTELAAINDAIDVLQSDLDSHTADEGNPHNTTAGDVDALPTGGGTVDGDVNVTGELGESSAVDVVDTPAGEQAVATDGGAQLVEQRVCDDCANMNSVPCFDCYLAGYRDTAGAIESDDVVDVELGDPSEGA